jgi:type I restriction enzyme S subunit
MAGEWRESTVGEIAAPVRNALVGGPFGSNLVSADYVDAGVPVIRGQNMGGRWVAGEFAHVTDAKADSLEANLARPGDIVFTQRGTLGQVSVVPSTGIDRYLVSQSQMKLTVNRELADPLFIYYVFSTVEQQDYIRQNAIQTGVPHTNLGILRGTSVPLPPLPEQRAIAHILGMLDDKIELNRRMNETLEALARALFKSWFVDFDPVRAKAEGRDPGLPQPKADLFPDSFDDSELGEIPKGWEVGSVDDEFGLTMGQSPPGETYNEAGVGLPFYQGCTDFGFRFPTRRVYCTAPTRLGKAGDTLVSVRAPVGDINMATEDCAIGRGVAAVRHKTGSRSYSYQFMQSIEEVFARFEAEGTVFGSIGKKDFHAITCVNPPRELVLAYEARVSLLDDRVEVNERESRTLAALRDTLLPKLVSGELRIQDAKRIADRATV